MERSGEVVNSFYRAVAQRDFVAARKYLSDDLVFDGLFETYPNPESYLQALTGLMKDAAVFFELETKAPAEAVTLVAEWHQVRDGKIFHVASAFDGRPFAALFEGAKKQ
jgi:hypothetical protein